MSTPWISVRPRKPVKSPARSAGAEGAGVAAGGASSGACQAGVAARDRLGSPTDGAAAMAGVQPVPSADSSGDSRASVGAGRTMLSSSKVFADRLGSEPASGSSPESSSRRRRRGSPSDVAPSVRAARFTGSTTGASSWTGRERSCTGSEEAVSVGGDCWVDP